MASKVLKSFLIGIGWDTKGLEAGDKKIQGSLQGVKSSALGMSAALIGAFGVGAAIIVSTSNKIDQLASATQNMRTPINTVYSFGSAVEAMGGQASEAIDTLKRLEEFQNNFKLNGVDGSIDALAKAGIDTGALARTADSGDAMDVYRELERQYQGLNEGQRAQVQATLGFSNGVARLLGEGKTESRMAQASGNTGSIDQMTESARQFAESSAGLSQKFEGLANELTEKFLPSLVGASEWTNKFIAEHRGEISKGIDYAADNPGATTALIGSSVSSVLGPILSKIGLGSIGGLVSKGGLAGVAVTGGAIGSNLVNQGLDKYVPGYHGASQGFDDLLKGVTGLDRIPGPLDLMSGRFPGFVDQPKVSASPSVSTPPVQQQSEPGITYKEVPPQNIDDLVKAQIAARRNMDRDVPLLSAPTDVSVDTYQSPPEPQADARNYKEVPSPRVDDLVMIMQAARMSANKDAAPLNQQDIDGSLSGVVDRRSPEQIYGDRSVTDSLPPESSSTRQEDIQANAEALGGVLSRTPIKVNNQLGVTLQLDGQALDSRIIQVNERQNYEAAGDFNATTER
ncbi:hypothetical protein [Pseudomonas sp. O11]|uniref:hypothetical protein n=1 Tax=Pseudomonas sp. O11 TaxID=3159446 RepID=UPI00387AC144